ncbi:hypothetical protein UlMin_024063 [Ulmus minor]
MDHYEVHGQRRDMKHKGRNVVWSIAMDKCLFEALAIQFMIQHSHFNLNLNNQKVVNHLKTIKKRYKIMKDMLSQDGFEWNPNTKVAHPDARQLYDELKIVCGNYQAPSHWAMLKDESFQTEMKNCEDDFASFVSPSSEDVSEIDGTMPNGSQEPPLVPPLRQLPKCPSSSEALQDAMLVAVMGIDGLEETKQMYTFEYLNADPIKARAFLTFNPWMRKIYLFREFWWWK